MDGPRFDEFARTLASSTTRRQALRLGGGSVVASLLALTGRREAAADDTPKPLGKKCRKDAQCASGFCDPDTATCAVATPPGTIVREELTEEDPVFGAGCAPNHHYDAYTFAHPGGPLSLAVRGVDSDGGTIVDPVVLLYTGGAAGSDLCTNTAIDDDSGCKLDAYLDLEELAAGTYTAAVVNLANQPGTYTFERNTFSGPEVCSA